MKKRIVTVLCIAISAILCLTAFAGCGSAKFDNTKNVSVVAREDGSGTKSAFMEIVGLKGKADVSGVIIGNGTAGVLAEVKGNPTAIAYESLGYVTSDVKKLKIDGVEATVENIKSGAYKIARPLNVIYKEETLNKDTTKAFYEFLNSSDAQAIIKDNGYVSGKDNAVSYVLKSGLSGEINISGSTSLQPLMIILAAKFEEIQTNVTVTVSGGGSGTGYQNGENGTSDFGMISEAFKSEKAPSCVSYEVAKDGIAIIVNLKNPIENISLANLKNIYNAEEPASSKITTWADVK